MRKLPLGLRLRLPTSEVDVGVRIGARAWRVCSWRDEPAAEPEPQPTSTEPVSGRLGVGGTDEFVTVGFEIQGGARDGQTVTVPLVRPQVERLIADLQHRVSQLR